MRPAVSDPRTAIRRLNLFGVGLIILLVGGIGGWASLSELSGAVIAQGLFDVESSVKKVQHETGGVVEDILVDEGAKVEAGQVLIKLQDTSVRSALGIVRSALDDQMVRVARLKAERDGAAAMSFPEGLADRREVATVVAAFNGERNLFEARRNTLAGQRSQLVEQVAQLNEQIRGLSAQIAAVQTQVALTAQQLKDITALYAKNLVSHDRLLGLQVSKSQLEGQEGDLTAQIAGARGKVAETELRILQLDKDFQSGVSSDLRDAEGKVSELLERLAAAEENQRRTEIQAPQAGIVHDLSIHTVGAVIAPGETIMSIVPVSDVLVIDAKVAPQDIDQVKLGGRADVRILAGNRRIVPVLGAQITRVSPDLTHEPQTNRSYYAVRLTLAADATESLGDLRLLPGMAAEVFFATGQRTPLQYLLQPLTEQIARAFRER